MRTPETLAGGEYDADEGYHPSDAELGVGETDEVIAAASTPNTEAAIAELMAKPEMAAAIEALVTARVASMSGGAQPAPAGVDPAMVAMMSTFAQAIAAALERNTLASASQQPGYVKPLPTEEIEARAAAFIDMQALIQRSIDEEWRPEYLLTEDFHAADYLWPKGDTIVWYGPPNTEMEPQNRPAGQIMAKMMRWIGGKPAHIADQVADAFQSRREGGVPDNARYAESGTRAMGEVYKNPSQIRLAERVEAPRRAVGPTRIAGTVVPEGPASATGGPQRQPSQGTHPQVGSVMPAESPSAAQHF